MVGGRDNPVQWCREVLGFDPWGKQAEVLESVRDNRTTVVRSCHAVGKSTVAAATVVWFLCTRPRSIVLTTATTHRQVKGILWREVAALLRKAKDRIGGSLSETRLKFDDDWWAWGFTSDEYDATQFQGFHAPHVLVVVDEAAGVNKAVFEGLDSAMSSGHARMLVIGNPTDGSGRFAELFQRSDISRFAISAFDTPNLSTFGITIEDIRQGDKLTSGPWMDKQTGPLPFPQLINPAWVREKWLDWCRGREEGETDPRWQAKVLGRFPEGGDRCLIPLRWIEEANARWEDTKLWPDRCRIGADIARMGDDSSERAFFYPGAGVKEIRSHEKADTMETTGILIADVDGLKEKGVTVEQVRVDADGLGAGVFDRLREVREALAFEVRNGMAAMDSARYANRRAEMYFDLRDALDPDGARRISLVPDTELTRELVAIHWKLNSRGRNIVESKDDIRARLGRSPDKADAVAYAVCETNSSDVTVIPDPDMMRAINPWGM